ncbi:MAG: hypothetical protein AAGF33_07785 [Pseudomonadota bacterium]
MLLRRITKHVKDQNWFAVGIDFVIVVVGVFIGIQVANWNSSQFERREEAAIVERLQSDFERVKSDADASLAFHIRMTEDIRTLLRSLRSGELKDDDIPALERALLLGTVVQTSADRAGSFTELMSSGRGNILRNRDLLHTLVDYEDFLERYGFAQAFYVETVLLMTDPYKGAFEYDTDMRLSEDIITLLDHGQRFVSYDFEELAADQDFHNAVEELLFVHSGLTMWRERISVRVDDIQKKLAASKR